MRERVVTFGADSSLVGVVAEPDADREARGPVFLFLNAGLVHRVGPNRMSVTLARRLAEVGFVSLRFDFSGIGDSRASRSVASQEERAVSEAIQAMDFLGRSVGADEFVLFGLCSGANVGVVLATSDDRVMGAVLINPSAIPSLTHTDEQVAEAWKRAQAHHHTSQLTDWRSWTRVFTARSDLIGVCRSALRLGLRLLRLEDSPANEADLGLLPEFDRRGVELLAVYTEGDTGLELLISHVGRLENLAPFERFQLETLSESDHILTPRWAQRRLEELVVDWTAQRISPVLKPTRPTHSTVSERRRDSS